MNSTPLSPFFKQRLRCFLLIALLVPGSLKLFGQNEPADSLAKYYEMSLQQLEQLKGKANSSELEKVINTLLSVASKKALSSRESPSIVSLITADDIQKSGARDLIDLLRTVPGFDFAYDGEAEIGIGTRGNWANEGKVLLLIDGQMMNQVSSGDLSFANHYPLSGINRIEIIRGPGSAIYGGFAEFGVINIVMKSGSEMDGVNVTGNYGLQSGSFGRRTIDFGIGKKIKDTEFSITGFLGEGNLSDGKSFVSPNSGFAREKFGLFSSLAGNSAANPAFINLKVSRKDFHAHVSYDGYETTFLNIADTQGDRSVTRKNQTLNVLVSRDIHFSKKLVITPQVSLVSQKPKIKGVPDSLGLTQDLGIRWSGIVNASYDVNRRINIAGGAQIFYDKATNSSDSIQTVSGFVKSIDYTNWATYLQLTVKTSLANIIAGGRYDYNSSYGDAFVPRLAITKKIDKFHIKGLYSSSFRAPTIENIARGISSTANAQPGIKPEKTTVFEIETGYQIGKNSLLQLNLFRSNIKDPIVNLGTFSIYTNYEKAATKGVEVEFQYKAKKFSFSTNYSFYSVKNESKVDIYATRMFNAADTLVPNGKVKDDAVLLAFPAHKLVGKINLSILPKVSVNANLIYNSRKYSYELVSTSTQNLYTHELQPSKEIVTADFFLKFDRIIKGLDVGAGVYNAFNGNFKFATPYYTGSGSLEGLSREWLLRISYKF